MAARNERHRVLQQALRAARQVAGLSQTEVAQRLRQPQSYVSKYEGGSRRLDLVELISVCEVLDISVQHLVEIVQKDMTNQ